MAAQMAITRAECFPIRLLSSLMRVIKAPGGLARGRGITPSTEATFIHVLPKCVPVCNALEEFSGVHSGSSDQHFDLHTSTTLRDMHDYHKYSDWLNEHSPFSFSAVDG